MLKKSQDIDATGFSTNKKKFGISSLPFSFVTMAK